MYDATPEISHTLRSLDVRTQYYFSAQRRSSIVGPEEPPAMDWEILRNSKSNQELQLMNRILGSIAFVVACLAEFERHFIVSISHEFRSSDVGPETLWPNWSPRNHHQTGHVIVVADKEMQHKCMPICVVVLASHNASCAGSRQSVNIHSELLHSTNKKVC